MIVRVMSMDESWMRVKSQEIEVHKEDWETRGLYNILSIKTKSDTWFEIIEKDVVYYTNKTWETGALYNYNILSIKTIIYI